jgi:hypothetical protein
VVVDDPLQGTICRPFPLYATFSTDMKYFGEYNWLSFIHQQYFMSVYKVAYNGNGRQIVPCNGSSNPTDANIRGLG